MSTKGTKVSLAEPSTSRAEEQAQAPDSPKHTGEGIGVFRGLILMFLSYLVFGLLIWFAWHTWKHWHVH